MKHVLLKNPRLRGIEYGMLRFLEHEIIRQTNAEVIEVPAYTHPLMHRIGHGMRLSSFRRLMPKKKLIIEADVIWYILMGPENYELDLFSHWELNAKHRIVYLFDTLEPQFSLIKNLFSDDLFTVRITSFNDAAPYLEKLTGRPWEVIAQAVPENLFVPTEVSRRTIDFSSYGRKLDSFHLSLKQYCDDHHFYYDFSTQSGRQLTATEEEAYHQYAWHVSHSIFTVSWPIELTNPQRAGKLHPITCRWFEGASAGTVLIGRKPNNPIFDIWLSPGLVQEVSTGLQQTEFWKQLDKLYDQRHDLLEQRAEILSHCKENWTWTDRVNQMLEFILKDPNLRNRCVVSESLSPIEIKNHSE